MEDFLTIGDSSSEQIRNLLQSAQQVKQMQQQGVSHAILSGKVLGMIFEKSSTRTRVSFEVGMLQLGGHAIFLSKNDIQLGRGETIADTARVLSRYVDGIMIRTFEHSKVVDLAEHATIPVINGLTDDHHPCQAMADLMTIAEHKGGFQGLKLCYVGDGNNMANSLLEAAVKVGMDIAVTTPRGYEPKQDIVDTCLQIAQNQNTSVVITNDPVEAMQGADVVYTDVWASMGQEQEQSKRHEIFQAYQVNSKLCANANPNYIFLHCLPAHRGEEVSAEIINGPHSVVFDQAENRLHIQKAILMELLATK